MIKKTLAEINSRIKKSLHPKYKEAFKSIRVEAKQDTSGMVLSATLTAVSSQVISSLKMKKLGAEKASERIQEVEEELPHDVLHNLYGHLEEPLELAIAYMRDENPDASKQQIAEMLDSLLTYKYPLDAKSTLDDPEDRDDEPVIQPQDPNAVDEIT